MSPNRRSYEDGVDDGNSSWHDRDRFQNDNDYYEGVRDGWREKEQRAEQARDEARQKMLDRASDGYDRAASDQSNDTFTFYNPPASSTVRNDPQPLPCGITIGLIFLSLLITFFTAPIWTVLAGPVFIFVPFLVFAIVLWVLIAIARSLTSK